MKTENFYNPVSDELLAELGEAVGEKYVWTDEDKLLQYETDEEGNPVWFKKPEVVVEPGSTEEVAKVMKLANKYKIPVTPRSAGTNVTAGAIPCRRGIVMHLERMNKIEEINAESMYAVVQTAVKTADIQSEVKRVGLMYAADPCSADVGCQIGGNAATNAGGDRAVKYGVTRNQIYSLEIVTPTGEITTVGGRIKKSTSGYALDQLMMGSEGTLGIITKVTLKLLPMPKYKEDMVAIFDSVEKAVKVPNELTKAGVPATSLEFMDNRSIKLVGDYLKSDLPYKDDGKSNYILITIEGFSEDEVNQAAEKAVGICENIGATDILESSERIWNARKNFAVAAREISRNYYAEDFVVPLDKIPELMEKLPGIEEKTGIWTMTSAHIGDGNVHTLLMQADIPDDKWLYKIHDFHDLVYAEVYKLGGKMSGEHGIGQKKVRDFKIHTDPVERTLMMRIKKALDPNLILNPDKIFPLEELIGLDITK